MGSFSFKFPDRDFVGAIHLKITQINKTKDNVFLRLFKV